MSNMKEINGKMVLFAKPLPGRYPPAYELGDPVAVYEGRDCSCNIVDQYERPVATIKAANSGSGKQGEDDMPRVRQIAEFLARELNDARPTRRL